MRNKTQQFKKKYNVKFNEKIENSDLKNVQKTFYRSTCQLNNPNTQTNLTLKSQRQLINTKIHQNHQYGNTGSRKLIVKQRKVQGLRRQNQNKQVSIKGIIEEMPLTTNGSVSDLKWKPAKSSSSIKESPQSFMEHLGKNQLFFCCGCYQYVFQIEKSRHYPTCRDRLLFDQVDRQKTIEICWQRLERIATLARYTQTRQRQVEDLLQQVKKGEFSRMLMINYPEQIQFFKHQQILQAFVFTYEHLLKGKMPRKKSNFFNCF